MMMGYQIKLPDWGFKPGKKESRQPVITGAEPVIPNSGSGTDYTPKPPYVKSTYKRQILDFVSQTFVSSNMQARDFNPLAKELIETGTTVLNADKGRMFMWNLPLFSFEINQSAIWERCTSLPGLTIKVSEYSVLLTPYIYLLEDICRLSLNKDEIGRLLYFRLLYTCLNWSGTMYGYPKMFCMATAQRAITSNEYFSLQQSINFSDWSATNCMQGLTLLQLLGVETWGDNKNGFFIQYGGGYLVSAPPYGGDIAYNVTSNMFQEGTTSIRARVCLPELFSPVANQPAILTTSAPIISGCIVRFVKKVV